MVAVAVCAEEIRHASSVCDSLDVAEVFIDHECLAVPSTVSVTVRAWCACVGVVDMHVSPPICASSLALRGNRDGPGGLANASTHCPASYFPPC